MPGCVMSARRRSAETPAGIGRPQPGNPQADQQTQHGHADQGRGRNPRSAAGRPTRSGYNAGARHRAADDRHDGRQAHEAVGRREPVGADDFGRQPILAGLNNAASVPMSVSTPYIR